MSSEIADPQLHLIERLGAAKSEVTKAQRQLLREIVECDLSEVWRGSGHKSMKFWLAEKLGTNTWMTERYIKAAHAIEILPHVSKALEAGLLSLEQTVELARFATPEDEARLVLWAKDKAVKHIRRRADNATKRLLKDVQKDDQARRLEMWWLADGSGMWLEAFLPADQGAVVEKAILRTEEKIAAEPIDGIDPATQRTMRQADALSTLCGQQLADDKDLDRATTVIHADLSALTADRGCCEFQAGPSINPETARRLVCDGRLETVVYDGEVIVGIGRRSRAVPPKLFRVLMKRDGCACAWPGCPSNRLQAHHMRHWVYGGKTDLPNLVLVCPLHHKFLHEYHWRIRLDADGTKTWLAPRRGPPHGRWATAA